MRRTVLSLGLLALSLMPAAAGEMAKIMVQDAYARSASPTAKTGAAFLVLVNHGAEDDRLIAAASDAAARVELHTHMETGDGVMKMVHVEEGFAIPAGETITMIRGGRHVMLMGLKEGLEQGAVVTITLTFEKAGEVPVEVMVDNDRKADHGAADHGSMDHSSHGSDS